MVRRPSGSKGVVSWLCLPVYRYGIFHLNFQIRNRILLVDVRIRTLIHDIECHPGQGTKLARAARTFTKIMEEPCTLFRLSSDVEKAYQRLLLMRMKLNKMALFHFITFIKQGRQGR